MDKLFGKYRATVLDNTDPMQMGRLMVQVADVSNVIPVVGHAVPAFRGQSERILCDPRSRLRRVDRVRAGEPGLSHLGGLLLGSSDEVPSQALAATPDTQQVVMQTVEMNTFVISDMSGPTGGIILTSSTGAYIAINDTGITIDNGQGASIVMSDQVSASTRVHCSDLEKRREG